MNSQKSKDIQQFAKDILGYDINPYQLKMVEAIIEGKQIKYVTQAGRVTAKKIALAYMQKYGIRS